MSRGQQALAHQRAQEGARVVRGHFDALGRWRDQDLGLPIDDAGKLGVGDQSTCTSSMGSVNAPVVQFTCPASGRYNVLTAPRYSNAGGRLDINVAASLRTQLINGLILWVPSTYPELLSAAEVNLTGNFSLQSVIGLSHLQMLLVQRLNQRQIVDLGYQMQNINDPVENIIVGLYHFKYLMGRYKNYELALAAYN